MRHVAEQFKAFPDLFNALRAVLLFHSAGPWDAEKSERWELLVGTREATTKALCDYIRTVIAAADQNS